MERLSSPLLLLVVLAARRDLCQPGLCAVALRKEASPQWTDRSDNVRERCAIRPHEGQAHPKRVAASPAPARQPTNSALRHATPPDEVVRARTAGRLAKASGRRATIARRSEFRGELSTIHRLITLSRDLRPIQPLAFWLHFPRLGRGRAVFQRGDRSTVPLFTQTVSFDL